MSDRDELAEDLFFVYEHAQLWQAEKQAQRLWAAGWRKKPSVAELTDCIISVDEQRDTDVLVAAIFALLDGPTETGEAVSDVR